MFEPLAIDVAERDGWTVVTARGQLDVGTAPQLQQTLQTAQVGAGHRLALDLREVEFIDDLGLGILVGAGKRARLGDGRFVCISDRPRFLELLAVTGLDRVLERVAVPDRLFGAARPTPVDGTEH